VSAYAPANLAEQPITGEGHHGLSDLQVRVLDVARDLPSIPDNGRREAYITNRLGISATAFWQHVTCLLDSQAAEAAYPVLIHRLRRRVEQRNAARGH
jgi:hypothetical protein